MRQMGDMKDVSTVASRMAVTMRYITKDSTKLMTRFFLLGIASVRQKVTASKSQTYSQKVLNPQ